MGLLFRLPILAMPLLDAAPSSSAPAPRLSLLACRCGISALATLPVVVIVVFCTCVLFFSFFCWLSLEALCLRSGGPMVLAPEAEMTDALRYTGSIFLVCRVCVAGVIEPLDTDFVFFTFNVDSLG